MTSTRVVVWVLMFLLLVPCALKITFPRAETAPIYLLADIAVALCELAAALLLWTPRWWRVGALSSFGVGLGWLLAGRFIETQDCRCFGAASAYVTSDWRLAWACVTVVLAGVVLDAARRS
jgi:hypothetical protein